MKFEQYLLLESEVDLSEVKRLLNKYCKQSDIKFPIYRGMSGGKEQHIISPRERMSISPAAFHNLYLDQNIKNMGTKYPLREKCLIGITHSDDGGALKYANNFGDDTYVLFPMDDAIIGLCDEYDILKTIFIDKPSIYLATLNDMRRGFISAYYGYSSELPNYKTTNEFMNDFYNMITYNKFEDEHHFKTFNAVFSGMSKEEMNNYFLKIFEPKNMRINFVSPKELRKYQKKEVWVGEKCVMMGLKQYRKLLKDGFEIGDEE